MHSNDSFPEMEKVNNSEKARVQKENPRFSAAVGGSSIAIELTMAELFKFRNLVKERSYFFQTLWQRLWSTRNTE